MGKSDPKGRGPQPRLDRFGTYRAFIDQKLPALIGTNKGSMAAGILWFVLFDMASGSDGTIRCASVRRLAERTGMTRVTVRAAMKKLLDAGALEKVTASRVPVYRMQHLLRKDSA